MVSQRFYFFNIVQANLPKINKTNGNRSQANRTPNYFDEEGTPEDIDHDGHPLTVKAAVRLYH